MKSNANLALRYNPGSLEQQDLMDVKTYALDRVLEALSPALAAELDRVIQETREILEREFQVRLLAEIREAEKKATATLQLQLEGAIERTREETRRQAANDLEQQFKEKLDAKTAQIKNELAQERARFEVLMSELNDKWSAERRKLQDEIEQWRTFSETQRQLAEASSQPEILSRFLRLTQSFAEGLALYVSRPDGLTLWKSRGTAAFPDIISSETRDPDRYFRILSVRGQTVGAVCAVPLFKVEALDFLATSLERAIEVFGLKLRAGSRMSGS